VGYVRDATHVSKVNGRCHRDDARAHYKDFTWHRSGFYFWQKSFESLDHRNSGNIGGQLVVLFEMLVRN
jgi:hypothetical protein